jgi:hypothetical protein
MKTLTKCLNTSRSKVFLAVLSLSTLFLVGQSQAAVNHVISNPAPSVFTKIQEVGFYGTAGLNTTANGLHRGNRLAAVLDGYAYLSENTNTCGGMHAFGTTGPLGILIVDVHDPAHPFLVGNIDNAIGLGSANVAAFRLDDGQHILVRMTSNACAIPQSAVLPTGVPEGMDVYNVDNPANPIFLTHVAIPEINTYNRTQNEGNDPSMDALAVGVVPSVLHKGGKTYMSFVVAADQTTLANMGAAQIWDFTNPSSPQRVSYWGSEMVQVAALALPITLADIPGLLNPNLQTLIDFVRAVNPTVPGAAFDSSPVNRGIFSLFMSHNGKRAFAPMSEGGLALLNTKDLSNPTLISVALDLDPDVFNLSKSVDSGAAAATNNGKTVVELDRDGTPYHLSNVVYGVSNTPLTPVAEGSLTQPIGSLPGAMFTGNTEYVGLACAANRPLLPPANSSVTVAVASRGACTFAEKMESIHLAGYSYFVVLNRASAGNNPIGGMAGSPVSVRLPGIDTSFPAGTAIFGLTSLPAIGTLGPSLTAHSDITNWGYVRIWDYSDETHPVLASTFQTLCASNAALVGTTACPNSTASQPVGGSYDPLTLQVRGYKAFVSWAQDGLVVIDIKDPYHPREVARFDTNHASHGLGRFVTPYLVNSGSDDDASNDDDNQLIYGIDVDQGLYMLKLNTGDDNQGGDH